MDTPDVVGYTLYKAVDILENSGFYISSIRITTPPKLESNESSDNCRVLKIKHNGEKQIELLVCKPL